MNIKEIAERAAYEYFNTLNGESLPEAIERAIREAAAPLVEALVLAEDVLSRFPYSSEMWPNGTHPNTGIMQIRAALAEWGAK